MVITKDEMKEVEDTAEQCGVTKLELMENAGRSVAEHIEQKYGDELKNKSIFIICGKGNNGGDGFVTAKYLYDLCKIKVLMLAPFNELSSDASINCEQLVDIDNTIIKLYEDKEEEKIDFSKYDIIIDAMLGYGIKGKPIYPYNNLIKQINNSGAYIVSIDIPSGLEPDIKEASHPDFVESDEVITFHDKKQILEHEMFKDKVKVVDIGIPV